MQQVYSGRVLKTQDLAFAANPHGEIAPYNDHEDQHDPDAILALANQQAEEIRREKLACVDAEFERRISERIVESTRELRLGVDSVADDMAEILTSALRDMIGDVRSSAIVRAALSAAIERYKAANIMKVRVSPQNFSDLELIRLGARLDGGLDGIRIETDSTLDEGRCIVQLKDKQIEVSLESQLQAFRKAVGRSSMIETAKGGI